MARFILNVYSRYFMLEYIILIICQDVVGELIVFPVDQHVDAGNNVRFNCSANGNGDINWQHGPQSDRMADVYIKGQGLVKPYSRTKRHSVEEDPDAGRCDLIITDAKKEDEGIYVCREKASRGKPPEAKLTVNGDHINEKIGLTDVMAVTGGAIQLSFSTCKSGPYYIDRVPVGKTDADDVYNGKLLNDYARSGRFQVGQNGDHCELNITGLQTPDAGTYTCRENSGLGHRHDRELIVIHETARVSSNDFSLATESLPQTVSYIRLDLNGHLNPLTRWTNKNCNFSSCCFLNMTNEVFNTTHDCKIVNPNNTPVTLDCLLWSERKPQENATKENCTSDEIGKTPNYCTGLIVTCVACTVAIIVVIVAITVFIKCRKRLPRKNIDSPSPEAVPLEMKEAAGTTENNIQAEDTTDNKVYRVAI